MEYKEENRICQNCKGNFTIEPDDFGFYEKIKVPPPTWCPECRMIRRLLWRNVRSLYKRFCGLCNKSLISMYSDRDPAPVYCTECWNGVGWDQFMYARDYDFSRNFFEQLDDIFKVNPRFYAYKFGNLINSEFTNFSKDNKNVYLSYSAVDCEDVMYSEIIDKSRYSLDSYDVQRIDNCFYNIACEGNYNTHYAFKSKDCIDSYFIYDCVNCSNCFLSSNLRNQQYVFNNKKLSKEEYLEKLEGYKLYTRSGIEKTKNDFNILIKNGAIHKYVFTYSTVNSSGDYIHNAKNIRQSFDTNDAEDIAYSNRVVEAKDSMDLSGVGFTAEMIYESLAATSNSYKDSFCFITIEGCRECQYSLNLKNCLHCFGCVGLTNASYCILNKQYTKEEYFQMVEKIKKHMDDMPYIDKKGRIFKYGEFFPPEMSPFGYNETNARDFFLISREEAITQKYNWTEKEKKDYTTTIISEDLPDDINDVDDNILKEIISCPNNGDSLTLCTGAFKITPTELIFYRQKKLPLPSFCPNCRHYQRLAYRNPMKLWHGKCMKEGCNNEFETSYAPDRPEMVYCENCYNKEVY